MGLYGEGLLRLEEMAIFGEGRRFCALEAKEYWGRLERIGMERGGCA